MASKVFLDANILLDFTLQRTGFDVARQLIQKGVEGEIRLFTTPAILHITSYWLRKAYKVPLVKQILLTLLNDLQIIDCDHATALISIHSNMDDLADALQYYTALKNNMNYFISSDKDLRKAAIPQLPVCTVQELLDDLNT